MPNHNVSNLYRRLIVNPPLTAFVFGLVWALIAMTVSRYWIVPTHIPSENGHILGDPLLYHNMALEQVRIIREQGLSAFQLHYGNQGTAGVTSLLYLIYPSPMLVVVLNALLHAIACAAVTRLLMIWFNPTVSLLATLPLLISPANIFWLAQINKESYAIAGCALFFLGNTLALKHALSRHFNPLWLLVAIAGIFLVYIPRPHLNQMLMLGFVVTSVLIIVTFLINKIYRPTALVAVQALILSITLGMLSQGGLGAAVNRAVVKAEKQNEISRDLEHKQQTQTSDQLKTTTKPLEAANSQEKNEEPTETADPAVVATKTTAAEAADQTDDPLGVVCYRKLKPANWQVADWLPEAINSRLRVLANVRCMNHGLRDVHDNPTTKDSIADTHVSIEGTQDMVGYTPRALQLGFFAPLPAQWPSGTFFSSFFYTTVPVMMVFFYLGTIATIIWVIRSKAWLVLPIFVISMAPLWVYGISTSFLGALFRYRYPVWIVLFCISMAALLTLLFVRQLKTEPITKN